MKKKEKEHLKEDPFQLFIEKSIDGFIQYKKQIVTAVVTIVVIIIAAAAIMHFKGASIEEENRLMTEALKIQENKDLSLDKKIEKLTQLKGKNGIAASIQLSMVALQFEKGDFKKARELLDKFPGSDIRLLNDKKKLLDAEILAASGKSKEALDKFNQIYSDSQCEIAKDFLLLKMARIQVKAKQLETAQANLEKLTEEFPRSHYSYEARTLLADIKK